MIRFEKRPWGAFLLLERILLCNWRVDFRRLMLLGCSALLSACAAHSLVSDVLTAAIDQSFGTPPDAIAGAALNPAYRYLRVQAGDSAPALLVLGYVDQHPGGEVQVWYSAKGEVLKLQDGRIVGTAGLATDWQAVSFAPALPAWNAVSPEGLVFTRRHDQTPGYRAGLSETVRLQAWPGLPGLALPASLPLAQAHSYAWYREQVEQPSPSSLPPAWFALAEREGRLGVVYSEQCLSPSLCLRLQAWPPEKAAP